MVTCLQHALNIDVYKVVFEVILPFLFKSEPENYTIIVPDAYCVPNSI